MVVAYVRGWGVCVAANLKFCLVISSRKLWRVVALKGEAVHTFVMGLLHYTKWNQFGCKQTKYKNQWVKTWFTYGVGLYTFTFIFRPVL